MKKRNRIKQVIITAAAALAILVFFSHVSKATRPLVTGPITKTVAAVESIAFDGQALRAEYLVESRCAAELHETRVEFEAVTEEYRRREKIVELRAVLVDVAKEHECSADGQTVAVAIELDLAAAAREKIAELIREGYSADPDYGISLPPVWPVAGDIEETDATVDTTEPGDKNKKTKFLKNDGKKDSQCAKIQAPPPAPAPRTVKLTSVEYVPNWRCVLDKKSSARRNTFDGTGTSEAAARNDAMMGCMRTNEPRCYLMSMDNAHTTCSAEIKQQKTVREFTAAMPEDGGNYLTAELQGPKAYWSCTLYKNDGARKDGFTGSGATLDEARNKAASGCGRTNHPKCREFAFDPSHTACSMQVEGN
ncbi:hypothetical protein ACFLQK_02180 [bacterium]